MTSYSFVVITDSKEPEKLQTLIASIEQQNFEQVEVSIVRDAKHEGRLGALRNAGCRQAKGDVIIVLDDDLILHEGFYKGLKKYGDDFDVLSCCIVNPDYTRYWDWKAHENGKNWLLDYGDTSPLISITGGLCIMKSWVFQKVQWDETRVINQEEDVDFSNRLKLNNIRIEFNPYSTVTHNANYTQFGRGVIKR